jgi:hypothetical protein
LARLKAVPDEFHLWHEPAANTDSEISLVLPDIAGKPDLQDYVVALRGMDEAGTALEQRHKRLSRLLEPFIDADAEGALAR